MIRKIIHIDEEKCNGCGACVNACHEGALAMVDGKARLMRDDYCDGLGNCLPECPTGAITFTEREAAAYDEEAVKKNLEVKGTATDGKTTNGRETTGSESQLAQWPCQIRLMPIKAPYLDGADLLIAADCTAYAYANMHEEFMKGRITVIGCPKLDATDYSEKLTEMIRENTIRSITVIRMEVPCCGGLEYAALTALKNSKKHLPHQVITISIDGKILE